MVRKSTSTDPLSLTFSALAHPVRRDMLLQLREKKATVKELSEPYEMSAPAITKHLKVLENARLITRSQDAQWRFSKIHVTPLIELSNWIDEYKILWSDRLDRLEDYVEKMTKGDKKSK